MVSSNSLEKADESVQRKTFFAAVAVTFLRISRMEFWLYSLLVFLIFIFIYHAADFGIQAYYNPKEISFSSLLLSREYLIAMSFGIVEFFIELWLVPSLKSSDSIFTYGAFLLGIVLVIFGDGLRKVSMITARQAFTHLIQYKKRPEHMLVTHGVYAFVRHPGYTGWFIWAPATQLLLRNPIATVLFTFVAWKFFEDRIPDEEEQLIRFFGQKYVDYKARVHSGLPFIE